VSVPSAKRAWSGLVVFTRSISAAVIVKDVKGGVSGTSRWKAISGGLVVVVGSRPNIHSERLSPASAPERLACTARFAGPEIESIPIASLGSDVIAAEVGAENGAVSKAKLVVGSAPPPVSLITCPAG